MLCGFAVGFGFFHDDRAFGVHQEAEPVGMGGQLGQGGWVLGVLRQVKQGEALKIMQQHIARLFVRRAAPAVGFGLGPGFFEVFAQAFAFDDQLAGNEAVHVAGAAVLLGHGVFALVLVGRDVKAGQKIRREQFFVGILTAGTFPFMGKGSKAGAQFVGGEWHGNQSPGRTDQEGNASEMHRK
jgi:hypothetical protein